MPQSNDRRNRLNALLAQLEMLDPERDAARLRDLMVAGAELVDRTEEPRRWAAFRSRYAQLAERDAPAQAIAAYRDVLTVWDPAADRDSWLACQEGLGLLLAHQEALTPALHQEAIDHLECAVQDLPYLAGPLAALYAFHTLGDPLENWRRRVAYLQQDAARVARDADPDRWARAQNALAVACQEEPDADFNQALAARIARHQEALAALPDRTGTTAVETCLALSECYCYLGGPQRAEHLRQAQAFARTALDACTPEHDWRLRAQALLGLARTLLRPDTPGGDTAIREVMALCDEAGRIVDPAASPALMATVESFRAHVCLERIQGGDAAQVHRLIAHGDTALRLLSAPEQLHNRRVVLQVVADGLLAVARYAQAADYLRRALDTAGAALARAVTPQGRMERIWEFRDSSALLACCLLRLNRTDEALAVLDRGKARFWQPNGPDWGAEALTPLIPPGGALLFANFAAATGAVVALTAQATAVVWLPHFGRARLLELKRGGAAADVLGGWLLAYSQRNTRPEAWQHTIEETGRVLYEELWAPVLERLSGLGVVPGAELVWFHQGGSSVFPLHAAWSAGADGQPRWVIDDYVIRYAPSVRSLLAAGSPPDRPAAALLVANPLGDLDHTGIESAWVREALGPARVEVLHGPAATREAVCAAIPRVDILHLATHARFDLNWPLQSCVSLAGGERLSIESLLPVLARHAPGLVVLSACETGVARITATPDESLGLPAAFLYAGTRTVLATLWPVDGAATALLIGRFYRERANQDKPQARALRDAQRWLRDLTAGEALTLLPEVHDAAVPLRKSVAELRTRLRNGPLDRRPFAAPWYWAAFTLSGQE
jgi:CHAT domain-containing protein